MAKRLLYVGLILFMVVSCTEAPIQEPITATSTKLQVLSFSSGDLDPPFNPFVRNYSISSINSLNKITVTAKRYAAKAIVKVNSTTLTSESASFSFEKGKDIFVTVTFQDSTEVYKVSWIPPNFPKYTINLSTATANGFVHFAQLSSGGTSCYTVIMDNGGFPVFYKKVSGILLGDFKKHVLENGKVRYSYLTNNPSITQILGGFQGYRIILDENFNEMTAIGSLIAPLGNPIAPESHDFILINDNHYIVPGYWVRHKVDLTAYGGGSSVDLVEMVLQEIKNGSIIMEWRSADFPEFLFNSDDLYKTQYTGPGPVDYFHFNSVCIDPIDGNLILSARHINQIFKVNRTTGMIMWRLGGKSDDFNLPPDMKFSHQHHVTRLQNGNLLIFDNGNTENPQQTRVLEFQLNENARKAALVWQYQEAGRYSSFMGSVQRLPNGNTLIGWGGASAASQIDRSDITEVDAQGNRVYDLSFTNQPTSQFSYRAYRFE